MVRSELVAALAKDHPDLTVKEVDRVVYCLFDAITQSLINGGRVELRGFGTFTTRARQSRLSRNPRSGEVVAVDAKRAVYFKSGKEMRSRLNF